MLWDTEVVCYQQLMDSSNQPEPDDQHEVSLEDLAAFATGEADEVTRERVKTAMSDIRHPLSYLIRTKEEVRQDLSKAEERPKANDET
jgi:hypothetical protein